jgi:membrane-associated HD superfamily phosphohydrolase
MVIPFTILYHLQLSSRQRWILYALFSLVIVTISVAIVRVVISSQNMRQTLNVTWLLFLTHVEANTCMPSRTTTIFQNRKC